MIKMWLVRDTVNHRLIHHHLLLPFHPLFSFSFPTHVVFRVYCSSIVITILYTACLLYTSLFIISNSSLVFIGFFLYTLPNSSIFLIAQFFFLPLLLSVLYVLDFLGVIVICMFRKQYICFFYNFHLLLCYFLITRFPVPVSYTHLDVYKRQSLYLFLFHILNTNDN